MVDGRPLGSDLLVDPVDGRLLGRDVILRRLHRELVVAVIDSGDHVAGAQMGVVVDLDRGR